MRQLVFSLYALSSTPPDTINVSPQVLIPGSQIASDKPPVATARNWNSAFDVTANILFKSLFPHGTINMPL